MAGLRRLWWRYSFEADGTASAEYSLILSVVVIGVAYAAVQLGENIEAGFGRVANTVFATTGTTEVGFAENAASPGSDGQASGDNGGETGSSGGQSNGHGSGGASENSSNDTDQGGNGREDTGGGAEFDPSDDLTIDDDTVDLDLDPDE